MLVWGCVCEKSDWIALPVCVCVCVCKNNDFVILSWYVLEPLLQTHCNRSNSNGWLYLQQIKQQWLVATRLFVGRIDGDELDWRFKKDFARVEELSNERNCGLLVIPSAIVADDVLVCSMGVVLFLNTQAVLSAVVEERISGEHVLKSKRETQ